MPRRKPRPDDGGGGRGRGRRRGARGRPTARRDDASDRPFGGGERVELWDDREWWVRAISGAASTKAYRCPGCDHLIPPATPHVVAWPVDASLASGSRSGVDERRHWHGGCWRARHHRRPR